MKQLQNFLADLFCEKKEVLTTFDPALYAKAKGVLSKANLAFETKTRNLGSAGRKNGQWASVGEDLSVEIQYQIFVKESAYEEAAYQLAQIGYHAPPV